MAAAAAAAGCLLGGDQSLGQEPAELPEEGQLHEAAGSRLGVDPIELWEDR